MLLLLLYSSLLLLLPPIDQGRVYADYDSVDEFVTIKNGGHCCMDQSTSTDAVNQEVKRYVDKLMSSSS